MGPRRGGRRPAAAMLGIVLWSTLAWYYGLPTSESHALIAWVKALGLGHLS